MMRLNTNNNAVELVDSLTTSKITTVAIVTIYIYINI